MDNKELIKQILEQMRRGEEPVVEGDENVKAGEFLGMPYSLKTQKEMQGMIKDGATMSGGMGAVGKAVPSIGRKVVDLLEPKADEAGVIANSWVEPFQGVRRFLQEQLGTGAANSKSTALHKAASEGVERAEQAALNANKSKWEPTVDQLIEGRRKVDLEAEKMMKDRLKKQAEESRRNASAEELTIPGLKGK